MLSWKMPRQFGAHLNIDNELSSTQYQVGLVLDTGHHCTMRCSGPTDEFKIWLDTKIEKKNHLSYKIVAINELLVNRRV